MKKLTDAEKFTHKLAGIAYAHDAYDLYLQIWGKFAFDTNAITDTHYVEGYVMGDTYVESLDKILLHRTKIILEMRWSEDPKERYRAEYCEIVRIIPYK